MVKQKPQHFQLYIEPTVWTTWQSSLTNFGLKLANFKMHLTITWYRRNVNITANIWNGKNVIYKFTILLCLWSTIYKIKSLKTHLQYTIVRPIQSLFNIWPKSTIFNYLFIWNKSKVYIKQNNIDGFSNYKLCAKT